ncbi:MAG: hypothetical protein C0402_04260 [Thermodesulfovibrio sp.]|nr:hypothetical protein [Thermodesulfovibrio sp.]
MSNESATPSAPRGRGFSLRTILPLLFTFQIIAAFGVTGYISYRNGQKTVDDMASQLCTEIMSRIEQHLDSYLNTAESINNTNLHLAQQGLLDVGNVQQLSHYFWDQGQRFRGLGTIAFGSREGDFIGANEPEKYIVLAHRSLTNGSIRRYAANQQGYMSNTVIREKPNYDARTRDWYQTAKKAGKPVWARISASVTGARLDLTAAAPYIDSSNVLKGIFMTDVSLGEISEFLRSLKIGKFGQVVIIERDGNVVASSFRETPYIVVDNAKGIIKRLSLKESKNPLIAEAGRQLVSNFSNLQSISGHQRLVEDVDGKRYFLQVAPYRNDGIDFLTAVILPEADFMEHISANNRTTLLFSLAALMIAIGFGIWTSRWVVQPIITLSSAAKKIGEGRWEQIPVSERADEIGELSRSFSTMGVQLQNSLETLQNEKEKTNAIIAGIGDGISIQNREYKVLYQNQIHINMVGSHLGEYCYEGYERKSEVCDSCPVAKTFLDGEIHTAARKVEFPHGTSYFELTTSPLRDATGEIIAGIEVVRDVTEKKKMEEELVRVQKLESVGVLAGGLAHDFNNLLTSIVGNISLAKLYIGQSNSAYERLQDAEKASLRATHLTRQLLTFSRGGAPIKKTVNISSTLKEAISFALSGSPVKAVFHIDEKLWNLNADEGQLNQVFNNLAVNAIQAMPNGGTLAVQALNVTPAENDIPLLPAGNYVKIAIADTGTGIPQEHLSRIFDPYFTTKQKGSGLGLSTVYSIVKKHDGQVTVDSKSGVGSTFTVYLKASQDKPLPPEAMGTVTIQGTGRILVMDDEKMVRDIAGKMLRTLGYEVFFARDGVEALDLYTKALHTPEAFNAVIMDLTIPGGMGGKETIQSLRILDPEVVALVSSGYSNDPIMAGFTDFGFKGVIAKPYTLEGLSRALRAALG